MKRNLTIAFMALLCLFSANINSQELTRKEAEIKRLSADKMEVDAYENLIMFVLMQDSTYYGKAIALFNNQKNTLAYLRENGIGDEFFKLTVEMAESVAESNLTIYGNKYYLLEPVLNDKAARDKKAKFLEKEYLVSKEGKKKFDPLLEEYLKKSAQYEKIYKLKAEKGII